MKTKFPEYLAMFRSQRGYTQARIAEKLKISRSTYANYESGNRSPDLEMLERKTGEVPGRRKRKLAIGVQNFRFLPEQRSAEVNGCRR